MTTDTEDIRMTFTEHLGELRNRLMYSVFAIGIGAVLCYVFSNQIVELLTLPLRPMAEAGMVTGGEVAEGQERVQPVAQAWVVMNPLEWVFIKFRVAGYGGLLLALPFVLYQIGAFIFPGLRPAERRIAMVLIVGCSVLGFAGVAIAYWGVFPLVLPYLLDWTPGWVDTQLRVTETLNVLIRGFLGFGIAFQFPMAVLILVYLGLLTPAALKQYRGIAIVGMALGSMLLTPPDPMSMMIMLAPLIVLYEFSILVAYVIVWRRKNNDAAA